MSRSVARRRYLRIGVAILLLLAIAALFRLWRIDSTPPGLFGDEAVNGLDALDVLAGRGRIFFPANYGREGLHMFIIAAFFKLMDVTPLALRLPSVIAGILTVLATFWLGRELFRSEMQKGKLVGVPLLAALWLATAYWHVHFSRFGIRGVFTPLFGALAAAAFWRGVNQWPASETDDAIQPVRHSHQGQGQRAHVLRSRWAPWGWFLLSGAFLGLSVHFYTASRLYPVFLGLFLLAQTAVAWYQKRRGEGWVRDSLLARFFWPILGLYAVAAAVFTPLGWYFLTHPGSFAKRASTVLAFGSQESPWIRIAQAVAGNVAQFFLPGRGDTAWFYNLPGRPLLEPITAVLALLGMLICLRRWRRAPYLFLLLWWPIMLLPAFLAVDRIPTAPRVLGVMPGLYFFPAIAIVEIADWVRGLRLPSRLRYSLVVGIFVIPLALASMWTARDYFGLWAPSAEAYEAFDGEVVDAVHWLQANPQPWPVYLSAEFYRHGSFMLLYSHTPTTEVFTYRDGTVRWFDGRSSLPLPPRADEATFLFTGIAHPDEERLAYYLPEKQLLYQSSDAAGGPSLTVFRASYRDRTQNPAQVSLEDGVTLTGYAVNGEARPGHSVGVVLHWGFTSPQPQNVGGYNVQLALIDHRGQSWPATPEHLAYRPPEWDTGSEAISWYRVSLPGEAPLGYYQLALRLVDVQTTAPLSEWAVLAPSEPVSRVDTEPLATFGVALRLLDAKVYLEARAGGEHLVAELLLDTTARLPESYTLFLHVLDADGQRVGQRDSATGSGLFPTDAWQPGQPLQDTYRIPIDVAGAGRPYRLALGFYDVQTGERLPAYARDGNRLPEDRLVLEVQTEGLNPP
jgi:4-amino-4-deoxy-L-arabinose transferase-like glycosyltransferase